MRAGHCCALFREYKENKQMTDLGEEMLNKKLLEFETRIKAEVEKLMDDGAVVINDVVAEYSDLDSELTAHPEMVDDVISGVVLAHFGNKLPWYAPEFLVRAAISKIVGVAIAKKAPPAK
jgi:hypothetical protein